MNNIQMRALRDYSLAGKRRHKGEVFSVSSVHARVLRLARLAEDFESAAPPPAMFVPPIETHTENQPRKPMRRHTR
jgi:hypothetical protein